MSKARFRCWDKFQEKYIFTGYHVFGEIACFNGMDQVAMETFEGRKEKYGYQSIIEAWNDFEEEPWTTMADKNSTDIYDGDIVKCTPYDERDKVIIGHVVQNRNGAWVIHPKDVIMSNITLFPFLQTCEVIGNMRENSDLIK